ncbi:MAG: M1 family metallopeptidase [Bacteroidetes bacterium]|nr:M1 family metallopeptidase [Bacteroidota bacterium]
MKYILSVIFLIHLSNTSLAQDSSICYLRDNAGRIREHNVDFAKMVLQVKFNTKEGKVSGQVKYDFKPLQYIVDTLFLNAPGIAIEKVLLDGKPVNFVTDTDGLVIRFAQSLNWNKNYKLDISYEATPRKGLYFIGWNVDTKNETKNRYFTRKQIWTQGQGIDNRHWIPCYDDVNDKMITETIITFDSAYTVVSNGILKSRKINTDGTSTWHYAMTKPMVPYLIMLAIDKYKYRDYTSKNGMVSRQYYYADRPETVEPTYQYSAEMMDWLPAELMVKYPWETYANVPVQDFMYGAMENTTATIFTDFYVMDWRQQLERNYVATNAHELTHQWFGDYITEYSAQHHWLHESFATYYAKQFTRKVYGEDSYEWNKRGEALQAINADRNDRFPVAHSQGGSARHYPKGSHVIDMMRYVLGDSVYRKCIAQYLKKHAFANVSNEDFKQAFMEFGGVNLDWFFNQWVYRAGIPDIEVTTNRNAYEVAFFIRQKQKKDELQDYFKMPVVCELHYKDLTSTSKRVWISRANDTIRIPIAYGKELDFLLFDPGSEILKTITFSKPFEELKAQAEKAQHFIDRYDAVVAMQSVTVNEKRAFLIQLFNSNNYHPLQEEIIKQLAKDDHASSTELLKKALTHANFNVRRAAIDNLETIPAALLPSVEKLLVDTSYQTIENTLRKLCKQFPADKERYLEIVSPVFGINNNVRIAFLELSIDAGVADKQVRTQELVDYTSDKFEFRTRGKAMDAVERLGICSTEVIRNLLNALLSSNGRLSGPASRTLKSLIRKEENKQLALGVASLTNWQKWQSDMIAKVLN